MLQMQVRDRLLRQILVAAVVAAEGIKDREAQAAPVS
jgi:hypothetical protein